MYMYMHMTSHMTDSASNTLNKHKKYKNLKHWTPLLKNKRNFFAMSKSGIQIQNINLQFCELYHEVFWYEQVEFHNISFVRLVFVVV